MPPNRVTFKLVTLMTQSSANTRVEKIAPSVMLKTVSFMCLALTAAGSLQFAHFPAFGNNEQQLYLPGGWRGNGEEKVVREKTGDVQDLIDFVNDRENTKEEKAKTREKVKLNEKLFPSRRKDSVNEEKKMKVRARKKYDKDAKEFKVKNTTKKKQWHEKSKKTEQFSIVKPTKLKLYAKDKDIAIKAEKTKGIHRKLKKKRNPIKGNGLGNKNNIIREPVQALGFTNNNPATDVATSPSEIKEVIIPAKKIVKPSMKVKRRKKQQKTENRSNNISVKKKMDHQKRQFRNPASALLGKIYHRDILTQA